MIHELKTWPQYFEAVKDGSKTVEVRKNNDRTFSVGDRLLLHEYNLNYGYTGRTIFCQVAYILDGPLAIPGFSIMSIKLL